LYAILFIKPTKFQSNSLPVFDYTGKNTALKIGAVPMTPTPGILFRIDATTSHQIREWIEELDWQYIKQRIQRIGRCMVAKIHRSPGEGRIHFLETVPEQPGAYRPITADVGGETTYRFCPQHNTVALHVQVRYRISGIAEHPVRAMTLNQPIENQVVADDYDILYINNALFKDGENFFGFTGEFFDILRAWERYSENVTEFEFEFQPLSIGCEVSVIHIESGDRLHVTADVNW
jgi:hypothetical protein